MTDPTAQITTPREAVLAAESMLCAQSSSPDGARFVEFWRITAAAPLAGFLYAASPMGNGKGMPWVLSAIDNTDPQASSEPSWAQAAHCCRETPLLAEQVSRPLELMTTRQRDSLLITLHEAVSPWQPAETG